MRYEGNKHMDNLDCKTQGHAKVCWDWENKLEKNDAYWNNFVAKGASVKDHIQ